VARGNAHAAIIFSGADSAGHQSTAIFTANGSNLVIELSNASSSDAQLQSDLLTAVFFDLATPNPLTLQNAVASGPLGIYQQNSSTNTNANGSLDLLSVSNLAAPGSTNGGPGTFVGGWQFREDLSGFGGKVNQTRGLGTNGLGIFEGSQVTDVDNDDYALTSSGDNVATSQSKQLFNYPVIKDSIKFTLTGLPSGFVLDTTSIANVRFQYGTKLSEPSTTALIGILVPEPTSLMILGSLLVGATAASSRRCHSTHWQS
jgi:hypothetical protein